MPSSNQDIFGISVVIVGQFNPSIFHPRWLAAEDLIRRDESDKAEIEIVHPEIASFSLAGLSGSPLKIQVTRNRFSVSTEDARLYEIARDLVAGVLGILRHTPTTMLGINVESHSAVDSEEPWHAFGHRLAPKEPWTDILDTPGMLNVTMRGRRPDGLAGNVDVRVQPSDRLKPYGIAIYVNDHYDSGSDTSGTDKVHSLLTTHWDSSLKRSRHIIKALEDLR